MITEPAALEIVVTFLVIGAFLFFLACSAITAVMMIHLTSLPERRASRRPPPQATPSAGSAD